MEMSSTANTTQKGLIRATMMATMTTTCCCTFLYINTTLLFTLRSKAVFRNTSRYVLLFNLLFADTLMMSVGQLLYLFSVCRVLLTYPFCAAVVYLAATASQISTLTLVVMSLERYVAVCFPLRHANFATIKNTAGSIGAIWATCSLNCMVRLLLFPFEGLKSLQMKILCNTNIFYSGPSSYIFHWAYTAFLFTVATLTIVYSFVSVAKAARSASNTDKASVNKARRTLLLHLLQLGLSLLSTIHTPIMRSVSKVVTWRLLEAIFIILYLLIYLLPRCLTALIYGIRDRTIRPVLFSHLCCCSEHIKKAHFSLNGNVCGVF